MSSNVLQVTAEIYFVQQFLFPLGSTYWANCFFKIETRTWFLQIDTDLTSRREQVFLFFEAARAEYDKDIQNKSPLYENVSYILVKLEPEWILKKKGIHYSDIPVN